MVSLQRTSTMTSTTPLTHNKRQKDFSTAFSNLQSQYGMSGGMPVPKPVETCSEPPKAQKYFSPSFTVPVPTTPSHSGKNYELAFGNLSSSYGFHGGFPTPVLKSERSSQHHPTKRSFASRGKPSAFPYS